MKDIARIAGVSQPAVSAALSTRKTSKVSQEMRKKILQIADELNYMPNNAAQCLKGKATRTIGIFGVPYVSVMTQALTLDISLQLSKNNYNLLSCYGDGETAEFQAVKELIGKGIDGLIITGFHNPLCQFKTPPIPYVFCPPCKLKGVDVTIDHASGTAAVLDELLRKGYSRPGYLVPCRSDTTSNSPNHEKYQGFLNALEKHHIAPIPDSLIVLEDYNGDIECIIKKIKSMKLDVLFCSNDYLASRLMNPLIASGIRIPEDLILIGYDGLSLCDITPVPLATIVQPNALFAKKIVEILLERIKNKQFAVAPRGIFLEPYFYPSESCGISNPLLKNLIPLIFLRNPV
jgi:LacI family transcriptional regulator